MKKQKLLAVAGCITLSLMAGLMTGCSSTKNTTDEKVTTRSKETSKVDGVLYAGVKVVGFEQEYDSDNKPKFTDIKIQDEVDGYEIKYIEEGAFEGVEEITGITMSDSITNIGQQAFMGCTNLESVTLPGKIENLGAKSFADCTSLSDVTFTKVEDMEVQNPGEDVFDNTKMFNDAKDNKESVLTSQKVLLKVNSDSSDITIDGEQVAAVYGTAFEDNTEQIEKLTITNMDTTDCLNLHKLNAKNVTFVNVGTVVMDVLDNLEIDTLCVENANNMIRKVTLNDIPVSSKVKKVIVKEVKSIGYYAFGGLEIEEAELKQVDRVYPKLFKTSDKEIAKVTTDEVDLMDCYALAALNAKEVDISNVDVIGKNAFQGGTFARLNLTDVDKIGVNDKEYDINEIMTDNGFNPDNEEEYLAFMSSEIYEHYDEENGITYPQYSKTEKLVINNVGTVADAVFSGVEFGEIEMENVKEIKKNAFLHILADSIKIKDVGKLHKNAFKDCADKIEKLTINGVNTIESLSFDGLQLKEVELKQVGTIKPRIFGTNAEQIEKVIIDDVDCMYYFALAQLKAKDVIISNVDIMGENVFNSCTIANLNISDVKEIGCDEYKQFDENDKAVYGEKKTREVMVAWGLDPDNDSDYDLYMGSDAYYNEVHGVSYPIGGKIDKLVIKDVAKINECVFDAVSEFGEIEFEGVIEINKHAFELVTAKSVKMKNVETLHKKAFEDAEVETMTQE